MRKLALIGVGALVIAAATITLAEERPSAEAKPLSEIAAMFEKEGYTIGEAEYDRNRWEIEAVKDDKHFELKVNATSGAVLSKRGESGVRIPSAGNKLLSEVAAGVEKAGYVISEAEFERDVWDIDAFKGTKAFDISVDPKTGKILSERED